MQPLDPASEKELTIPVALQRAAARYQGRVAYFDGADRPGWGELYSRASRAAAGLRSFGLRPGDRAAICAENSIEWIVAYHAVLLAGGVGVLVYYDLKAPEIRHQVTWPESRFLLASPSVLQKLPGGVPGVEKVIVIGEGQDAPAGALTLAGLAAASAGADDTESFERAAVAPDDLAAIIYTSGTTGGAKGVMLSHRNFLANGRSVVEAFGFNDDDSALLVLPLHHAMPFLAAVILPLLTGAQFFFENDLRRVRDRLQQYRPTVFFGVPALYDVVYRNVLARAESEGRLPTLQAWQRRLGAVKRLTGVNLGPLVFKQVHGALGGRLRMLFSGGAALSPRTAESFFSLGLPLLQGWGMTEASPVIAVQRFSARRFRYTRYYERRIGSVGPPVPDVEVRLIDVPEKDIVVAVQGEGEVIVRGENIFQGYWRSEEATREAKRDGWLHTGDLARIDREGHIYLTGRSKYVIVLESGEKVHPDELEDKLRESELLQDVCIVGRRQRDKTQVTAIVYPGAEAAERLAAGANLGPDLVQRLVSAEVDRLSRELAAYKRVSRIELSDTPLPKTALQKVARGAIEEGYEFSIERWAASDQAQ